VQWDLHCCNDGNSPKIVLPPYVLCISRSYITFHAINLTFRQNAVIFKLDRKNKAQEETLMKSKIMTMAANVIQYLTDRERHEWALITPGGFYEPARPKETEE